MLKQIALAASVVVLSGGLAGAQQTMTHPAPATPPTAATGRSVVTVPSSLSTDHWLASDVYKANVYDNSENKIGSVSDLVMDTNGNITTAVIGVGGFLGVGQKDVAIPFKDLKVASKNGKDWLVLNRTKDELKSAPDYHRANEPKKM